ncbi:MAG: thioredoxin family protein [Candidatus Dormibacteria bacterium]
MSAVSMTHPASPGVLTAGIADVEVLLKQLKARKAQLPLEGQMPELVGAEGWLNSPPLTREDLAGNVVLFDFWTYTCINWLRTLAYVRAWADKYRDHGLVVVGVHTPEFPFEADPANVRTAVQQMNIGYPVALDPNFALWNAFDNHYWPALYIVDAEGRIRHHHFGEGGFDMTEMVLQQLLAWAGFTSFAPGLVAPDARGVEAEADWSALASPETYVGYEQAENFSSPGGVVTDGAAVYTAPDKLRVNEWALTGDWTVGGRAGTVNAAGGSLVFRFHARDVHLVMAPGAGGGARRFHVSLDGSPPGDAHGLDVDGAGAGLVREPRLYQLIRQQGGVEDRTIEIVFEDPGAEAYVFTFG